MTQKKSLWGGRFREPLSETALKFSSSIDLDKMMYREDIAGSIAHIEMLAAVKLISGEEARRIRTALRSIEKEIDNGSLDLSWTKEDIHMAIEQRLIEKIGSTGGKLHTGRSRNDQVALDERLYLRGAISEIEKLLLQIQRMLLYLSEKYFDSIVPGYTHLQRAQPIYLSQYFLAYIAMFERDDERMQDCLSRMNKSPLGAAALAGTSLPIDRSMVAKKLGFAGIVENSIDAVSDRDYLVEFVSTSSILMMHLSRFAEELILWSSAEFSFVTIDDAYTTGSSIMPQKKNPDMAELLRAKTGRVYGNLVNLLTLMKGLPLAYNRDMQEDKTPLFDTVKTVRECLFIFSHLLVHTKYNVHRFDDELSADFLTATDLAEYLVEKGVPFRQAHTATGKIVSYSIEHKKELRSLTLQEYRKFSDVIDEDVYSVLHPRDSVERKKSAGSTSPHEVKKQIVYWTRHLKNKIVKKAS